jgi:hypothetical protein
LVGEEGLTQVVCWTIRRGKKVNCGKNVDISHTGKLDFAPANPDYPDKNLD